jgi:hypothetical protein
LRSWTQSPDAPGRNAEDAMSWVTVVWSMIASACLTLALVHGLVWWSHREARPNLLFALTAVARWKSHKAAAMG